MSKDWRRRLSRRRLRSHDRGDNRHNKGVSYLSKEERQVAERMITHVPKLPKKRNRNNHILSTPVTVEDDRVILCQRCCNILWIESEGYTSRFDMPCW
jgi:RNA 3'-terminal phosphate cyclase